MKVAIMQPYIYPYLGYFQLISSVDTFVFFDDVNFIKKGWINRNNILLNGQPHLFSIPLTKASQNKRINEIIVIAESDWSNKLLKTLEIAYKKAPEFSAIFPMIEKVLSSIRPDTTISEFAIRTIQSVVKYLGLETNLIRSSSMDYEKNQSGQQKIIDICLKLNADRYVNPMNGQDFYEKQEFSSNGIDLKFIFKDSINYKQFSDHFKDNLSIIDVLMFNNRDEVIEYLSSYTLK